MTYTSLVKDGRLHDSGRHSPSASPLVLPSDVLRLTPIRTRDLAKSLALQTFSDGFAFTSMRDARPTPASGPPRVGRRRDPGLFCPSDSAAVLPPLSSLALGVRDLVASRRVVGGGTQGFFAPATARPCFPLSPALHSRFATWLRHAGLYESYMNKLRGCLQPRDHRGAHVSVAHQRRLRWSALRL